MRLAKYIEAMSGLKVCLIDYTEIYQFQLQGAITILQHCAYLVHLLVMFINNLSDDPLLKTLGPNFRSYFYRGFHQFKSVFAEFKSSHHEFLFRAKIHEVPKLREEGSPKIPLQCARVIRMVRDGYFGFKDYFQSLCNTVDGGKDFYFLGSDFESYLEAQAVVDKAFADSNKWTQMSILSTAGSGIFSSDRTIQDYAEKTWGIEPCRFPSDG
ncbi:unnamed protein product [Prunus armeniaca]